jgi:hypothetical protein
MTNDDQTTALLWAFACFVVAGVYCLVLAAVGLLSKAKDSIWRMGRSIDGGGRKR